MEMLFNCVGLRTLFPNSIMRRDVVYVEGEHEEAQRYFEKHNVKSVKPFRRFRMFDDKRYVLVACTFLKSEDDQFNEALYELQSDMLILGYRDYEAFCKKAFVALKLIPA